VGSGHAAVVQLLLDAGAAVDAQQPTGRTALHVAAREGQAAVTQLLLSAQLLLDAGAAVDAGNAVYTATQPCVVHVRPWVTVQQSCNCCWLQAHR
jgi:ankyrin repeat protein